MGKKGFLTKALAIAGTILTLFPVLAPLLMTIPGLLSGGGFNFDYLMPAELFPMTVLGGGLLIWASVRSRLHRRLVLWSALAVAGVPLLGIALTTLSGLASGAAEPVGLLGILFFGIIALFWLAVAALGICGIILVRDLYRKQGPAIVPPIQNTPMGDDFQG